MTEEGTHEELVRRHGGMYQRLFERQALGLVMSESDAEFDDEADRSWSRRCGNAIRKKICQVGKFVGL